VIASGSPLTGTTIPVAAINAAESAKCGQGEALISRLAARSLRVRGLTRSCLSELSGVREVCRIEPIAMILVTAEQYLNWADSLFQSHDPARIGAPVWIQESAETRGIVLGAVAADDTEVLEHSRRLAAALDTDLHLIHAIPNQPATQLVAELATGADEIGSEQTRIETGHVADIHATAQQWQVPPEHVHIKHGDIAEASADVADRMQVAVIVVGASRPSLLRRLFSRTTEQSLVKRLHTDILIVGAS